jgi:hypothetical protein
VFIREIRGQNLLLRRGLVLGKQIGGLGNKFGAFAEGLAFSPIERILRTDFGMESITPRFSVVKGGESQELDVKTPPRFVPKIYWTEQS